MKMRFLVTEELSRSQVVELDVPEDLLIDGETPDYLIEPDARQVYEEWVTEKVYLEAYSQGDWDTKTRESDWEESA